MNKYTCLSVQILFLYIGMQLFSSCIQEDKDHLSIPEIQAGIAKISGRVLNFQLKEGAEFPILNLKVQYPVTAEVAEFETQLKKDGSFLFEIPVECNAVAHLQSEIYNGGICIAPDEESKLEISFEKTGNTSVNMQSSVGLTSNDVLKLNDVLTKLLDLPPRKRIFDMNPTDFSQYIIDIELENILKMNENDTNLSGSAKEFISVYLKSYYLRYVLFSYSKIMRINYLNNSETKDASDNFVPQEPDKSYYGFLKYFDLNNPQYLYSDCYFMVLQTILSNETLNIPPIGDTPIKDWLDEVKATMADLIGFDTGLFYDMLAANVYAKQFNEENKPLSDKQKENIKHYFKNKSTTKILLAKNEKIIKISNENQGIKNKTPEVSDGTTIMDAIISKYKGKAVVVDFWATWCGPCLEAMRKSKAIKNEMQNKDIVFVYITNTSSPRGTWEKKVNEIGGEHYYLSQKEWEYLLDNFGFDVIPTYLFYDANGVFKNKVTGYRAEDMRKMIEELL